MSEPLTAEVLRGLIRYDPITGRFTWSETHPSHFVAGHRAGKLRADGYRLIKIDYRLYREHRLAWLYVHGQWPVQQLDHINGQRDDNRLANLREVSATENTQNRRKAGRRTSTGLLGAAPTSHGKFGAKIMARGVVQHLGTFETAEAAHAAYVTAKRQLHPSCTI